MVNYAALTETELADLLRTGDEAAFGTIYKRYWDKLLVVAGRRLGDLAEAEEVVQDIFLNLWKRRETFSLRVGFENYFAIAVKFEIINRLAKRARELNRNNEFSVNLSPEAAAFERFDFDLLQKQLAYTINNLPPKCQLVFKMSREADLTNKNIARELDISEKAVEKHITYALKTLRTRFGQYFSFLLFFI
ncbi:MAG: RNA polymerase sigma-70 factor [Bacteroidota bacterium]